MKKCFLSLALFCFLSNFLFAQFPYNYSKQFPDFKEKPEFLYDFGIYPLDEKNGYHLWYQLKKLEKWDYNFLVEKGETTKVIRHDFGSEMYNLPDYKSIINFDSLGNLESEQRWKEDTLIWKKFFKYRENNLVDEIEIQNLQKGTEEKIRIRYDYDSANRVISEKVEGANSVIIEEQQIKYIKDTIQQSVFKYSKLKWRKFFIYENGILRELIIFRKALQKATNHIKYNENGIRIYSMMKSGKIIKKYDDEGLEIFCEVFDGNKSIRSYFNHNKKRYDSHGNITFQEFWDYGKLYSRDSSYYIYDEGGNIIEKQYFVWRDNNFYKLSFSKYIYDSSGRKIKGQLYRGNEYADSTLFIYSESGNLVREEFYPSVLDGKMRSLKEYEYSDKNELIKKTVYGIDGELDYEEGIKFNKNGQKIERHTVYSEYDKEGNQIYDFKKKYDSLGRIVMHIKILPGEENERRLANKWEIFYK